MTDKIKKNAERLDNFTKPIRNIAWLVALATGLIVQFLGPGLVHVVRMMAGSEEIRVEMQDGFEKLDGRLTFIEANFTPPKVVNWNFNRQIGLCGDDDCRVFHNISRTEYGDTCGEPIASAEIKVSTTGQTFDLPFAPGFEAVEADRGGRNVIVPFNIAEIDKFLLPDGTHHYQFTNIYPTCPWNEEPKPRYSPWFQIVVSRDN